MFILTVTIENIGQKMYKYLSFIQNMFTCNSRVLTKHIIMVGFAPVKVSSLLHDLNRGPGPTIDRHRQHPPQMWVCFGQTVTPLRSALINTTSTSNHTYKRNQPQHNNLLYCIVFDHQRTPRI